jgi:hypothetical protein
MTAVAREKRFDDAALMTLASSAAVLAIAISGVVLDNPGEVEAGDLVRPTFVGLALALAVPTIFFLIGGVLRYVAFAFPIFLFAFFKFSGFMGVAEFLGLFGTAGFYAALAGLLVVGAVAADSVRRRDERQVARVVFFVAGAMAAASLIGAVGSMLDKNAPGEEVADRIATEIKAPDLKGADLPDIIYLVPDRYGSEETLQRHFNHDNEPFFAELESRGFFVRRDARSNYAKTVSSLASSMNMADLSALNETMGEDAWNRYPLFRLIRENAAQRILRDAGYDYHHLGNWWGPSRRNPHADVTFFGVDTFWSKTTELEKAIMRLTPIASIATDGAAAERVECSRIKNQLDYIEQARAKAKAPLYLYAHLTIPHDPVTMDENGNCIEHVYYPGGGTSWPDYQRAYAGYVTYLNKRLLEIFDAAKRAENGRGLIFVVQADEGPYPKRLQQDGLMVMQDFNDVEIREKFGIINTIYWDAEKYGAPYLTETPINNWRIILSKISGEEIPLVEDERSWLMYSDQYVYNVEDVTSVMTAPVETRTLHAAR